ncbi:MAG: MFS transporter [Lentisphaeria bacterium]|nr:MFS transporter [Lentisphaeria bacterium]
MSTYADHLADPVRKRFRLCAYASTWFGCFADVMLESTAVIILYFSALGAGNTLIMFSTGIPGLVSLFLLIPVSGLVDRIGAKKTVSLSCLLACFSYLLMASAPFWRTEFDQYVVLAGCLLFCLSKPLWTASWFPILGYILRPAERSEFFGFMRFSYYILSGTVFFLLGLFMGKNPPVRLLQAVIALTGLCMLGRMFFISKIRIPEHRSRNYDIGKAFGVSVRNAPLAGFAVYIGALSLAFASVIPLTLLYLKNGLHYGADTVQILSSAGIGGCICGYFLYGRMVRKFGMKALQLLIHGAFIVIPLGLFVCKPSVVLMGVFLFAANFSFACFGCAVSSEILALARPGNLTMANAFSQTYQMIGTASGRLVVSFLLGSGVLSSSWRFWSVEVSLFQTIFLFCSGTALFSLTLVFCLPSVVPRHEDYYDP